MFLAEDFDFDFGQEPLLFVDLRIKEITLEQLVLYIDIENNSSDNLENTLKYKIDNNDIKQYTFNIVEAIPTMKVNLEEYNFKPNTEHTIKVDISTDTELVGSRTLKFTLPQSFPEVIKNLVLSYNEQTSDFLAMFDKPTSWGYWKDNLYGYKVTLLVNGNETFSDIILSSSTQLENNKTFFKLSTSNLTINGNASIQIYLQTWAEDDLGKQILNQSKVFSNSIYLKSNFIPVNLYLKTDKGFKLISLINNVER